MKHPRHVATQLFYIPHHRHPHLLLPQLALMNVPCLMRQITQYRQTSNCPTARVKVVLASSLVQEFPRLKDKEGEGYEAWYCRGVGGKPATGFIEERLRNVRKRMNPEKSTKRLSSSGSPSLSASLTLEKATHSTSDNIAKLAWLKHNHEPESQVKEYMKQTAHLRAIQIKENPDKSLEGILRDHPRLLDIGMIELDFKVLYEDKADLLFERWETTFANRVLAYAAVQRPGWKKLFNLDVDDLTDDEESVIALQLLPLVLPTKPFKNGKQVVRPSQMEAYRKFIEFLPIGTDLNYHLGKDENGPPHIITIGCSAKNPTEAFVAFEQNAIKCPTLLKAVDLCFKSFYILDVNYPRECYTVWEFLQTVVYEMGDEKSSPLIKSLRNFFLPDD
ncbi:uncharacterized protein LOC106158524 isoform X2 [Lingula anatina]|uniref:Uncharacterized protein LOC106158524 isoform X2 n=1 Tax=Lingula anatina TaxID=7574 RepID=A0A1S3HWU5_LINAN|nr:uncharacterized protein LOC106158524 isoform X2 [Lingula anatina]XP_013390026.1 uncharacterized protein LOC106158524 isoform X2 [Lingula anatina]|eukprot:XP_013390018.1 uncharacterized protein LOC106158524 isoform X2 [Lingula anatina]